MSRTIHDRSPRIWQKARREGVEESMIKREGRIAHALRLDLVELGEAKSSARRGTHASVVSFVPASVPSFEEFFSTPKAVYYGHINALEDSINRLRQLRQEIWAADDRRHMTMFNLVIEANVLMGRERDILRAIDEIRVRDEFDESDRDAA